jgi:hypothetical protein
MDPLVEIYNTVFGAKSGFVFCYITVATSPPEKNPLELKNSLGLKKIN